MSDCKSKVGSSMARDEFIVLLVTLLWQMHLILVLWTHYKNAHLVKSKGGCQPDAPADIQMGGHFDHNGGMD